MIAGFGIDELNIDSQPVAAALYRAFEGVTHAELAPELLEIDSLALVAERRMPADHERAGDARQVRRQAFGNAIDEIFLRRIAAQIGERKHHNRQARRR